MEMIPKPGNVFVLDPFEGRVYNYLEEQFMALRHFM
jgi:hypothetical protein